MKGIIIKKLHGSGDFFIDLSRNVNIIIGENGTGKSTLINIFFSFITRQWAKLIKFDFYSIVILESNTEILKSEIGDIFRIRNFEGLSDRDLLIFEHNEYRRRLFENNILHRYDFSTDSNISYPDFPDISHITGQTLRVKKVSKVEHAKLEKIRRKVNEFLKSYEDTQFVLLPTYRRIEKEIERFLPKDREGELKETKITGGNSKSRYIEIYGSGMADVDSKIVDYISQLREKFHSELNLLTQSYIKDIINEHYKDASSSSIKLINDIPAADLSQYLHGSFTELEIEKILNFMSNYEENAKKRENAQFSYFIAKLVNLYTEQLEREKPIIEFFSMCNSYFAESERVEFIFSREKFTYRVIKYQPNKEVDLKLSDLSSGQKQIVSLFSHIYLGGENKYYLVIDEPELSISVEWQKRILRDIYQNPKCSGILAVTHSPFIFDNNLITSVSSINDLRRR